MAATSPLVRLRRLALPLALVALCAAAAHGQTVTSAFLTTSTTITVTLSNSTGTSTDCRNAFSYLDLNNGTKASPFANCTANGTSTVRLTLTSAGTYAAGDQLNIKVNQTTLNTTAGAVFVPAAAAVAVPPVIGAATLTASRTLTVKLPLSGNTVPDNFATNMTVCGGAVELRAAGASAAKAAPFEACSLAADVLTLTLKSAGTYAPGDTVNVVNGQSILKFGTTAYAPLASGSVIRPTLTSVSLSSTSTILVGTSGPASLPGNATAAVCNAVFDIALKNGTILAGALSACSVGPGVTSITATFANGTTYSDGMTVTLKANQTSLKAGDQSAAAPLFVAPASALAIAPTILSASLTAADTITVVLPVASTLDTSACNSAFELRTAGSATAKSSPFSACSLAVNNTQAVLTLASASTYSSGDILDIKSGNDKLLAGTTAYVPQSVTVLPTITAATLVSSTVVRVALPVVSSIPTPYSADDCARSIIIAASNSTVAKAISACALSTDKKALLVTLTAAYAPGDTVNVRTGQWQLRAGASVTLGPNYIAGAAPVAILPGLSSATLTSATQVVVTLPAASIFSASDCAAAIDLVSAGGVSKSAPFAACALGSGNTSLILNLTATAYAIGDTVTVKASQTALKVGNTSYTPYTVSITPILLATTTAVLVSETSISVTLPTGFNSYLPSNLNASDCNAAFVLVSAAGAAKTAPYTSCTAAGTALTLGIAAGTYAAGDSINVKSGNSLFLGSSSSGPAYVPAANGTQITPTIVSAAIVGTQSLFVTLSAAASTSAFNGTLCNDALEVTSGSATVFANCTLTSDGKGINLVLSAPSSVTTSNTVNVKASQTMLKAAGSDAASSPAFARLTTPIPVVEAKLTGAYLTSSNTIVAKLGARAAAADGFACNSVFVLLQSNGSVRASAPFTACTLSSDGLSVTLTTTTYTSKDRLNIRSTNSVLQVFSTSNGPNYPNVSADASAPEIAPTITKAMATSPSTVVVPLPIASNIGSCASLRVRAVDDAGKSITDCELDEATTQLTVTIGTNFAAGDKIDIVGTSLTAVDASGAQYKAMPGATPVTIAPTVGAAQAISSNTISVVLPATTNAATTLTADACASAIDVSGKSFSSCTISSTTLTLVLSSAYAASDKINVKADQKVLRLGTGASSTYYVPLPSSVAVIPTIASAKAISTKVIVATLPVASTFVDPATNASVAKADQALCTDAIGVGSRTLVDAADACNLNSTTSLTITLSDSFVPNTDSLTVDAAQDILYAGTGLAAGQPYQSRTLKINPAYLEDPVLALDSTTLRVQLPVASGLYDSSLDSGNQLSGTLSADRCNSIFEIKPAKLASSCSLDTGDTGTILTIKLASAYASGDAFNFKDTNVLLRAAASGDAVAYKSMPTAATINPTLVAAKATKAGTVVITLPAASSFTGGATSLSDTDCTPILDFSSAVTLKAGDGACVITGGTTLTVTLDADTTPVTAGLTVDIAADQETLFGGASGASGPAYKPGVEAVMISPAYLTSAVSRSAYSLVVTLPFTANIGGDSTVDPISKSDCAKIIEVLAGGDESKPRTLAASGPCALDADAAPNTLTISLDDTESSNAIAAGDTVRIKSTNSLLLVGTSNGNAAYMQADSATKIAVGYFSSAVATAEDRIVVTFPVAVTFVTADGVQTALNADDCAAVFDITSGTILTDTSACALSGGNKVVTIKLDTEGDVYTTSTTIDIQADNEILLTGSGTAGATASSLTEAIAVQPGYITSVIATADRTIELTLPFAPAGATVGSTLAECAESITITAANSSTKAFTSTCAVSSSTVTITLSDDADKFAPGDVLSITAKNTDNAYLKTSSNNIPYAAISKPVSPGYITSKAVATGAKKVVIELPVASNLASDAVCEDIFAVVDTSTNPDTVFETGCAAELDDTGMFLTLSSLSADLSGTPTVDIKTGNEKFTLGKTGSTAAWVPLDTAVSVDPVVYDDALVTVTAVAEKVLHVQLPMASVMSDLTASACGDLVQLTGNTLRGGCKLMADANDVKNILVVNLADAYANGDTLSLQSSTVLRTGSSSGSTYDALADLVIKPTIVSAVAITNVKVLVTFPAASSIYDDDGAILTGSATQACSAVFAVTGVTTITCDTQPGAASSLSITLDSAYSPGNTIQVGAMTTDINLHAASATPSTAGEAYVAAEAPIKIAPAISSAQLTGPRTIVVALPVVSAAPPAAEWDCNAVFALYATGSATAKSGSIFSKCELSDDKLSVTLTLTNAASGAASDSTYAPGDTINVLTSQSLLYGVSTDVASLIAYAPRPAGFLVTIVPTLASAVATDTTTIVVQLPVASYTSSTATGWDCGDSIKVYTSLDVAKAGTSTACKLSGSILTYTLAGTGDVFANGDYIKFVDVDAVDLTAGTSSGGPTYDPDAKTPIYNLKTGGAEAILSARAVGVRTIEVELPTVSTTTSSTCSSYLTVTGITSVTYTCTLDATGRIITVSLSKDFVSTGVTVGIPSSATLKYATSSTQTASYPSTTTAVDVLPTISSAYFKDSKTIIATLPITSAMIKLSATAASGDTVTGCTDIATVTSYDGTARTIDCVIPVAGATTMTISSATDFAAGDTVNILADNAATGTYYMVVGTSDTNDLYAPRRQAVTVTPRIVSATASGTRIIQVGLSVPAIFYDKDTAAVLTTPSQAQCNGIFTIPSKSAAATSPCSLSDDGLTLTINLSSDFAPGDTFIIKDTNTFLRGATYDGEVTGDVYGAAGPAYGPSAAATPIVIGFFTRAYATDSKTIFVILPFPTKMFSAQTGGTEVTTPTKANCDNVVRVMDGASALALAASGSSPCTLVDSTTLQIKLASTTYAGGVKIEVGAGGAEAILRAAASGATPTSASTPYLAAADADLPTIATQSIKPTILSAAATSSSTIVVTLVLDVDDSTSTFNASACSKFVTFTPSRQIATAADACTLESGGTGTLTIKLAGTGSDVYTGSDKININIENTAALPFPLQVPLAVRRRQLLAVAAPEDSLLYASALTAVTITPNLVSATAISATVIEIQLPAPSYIPDGLSASECGAIFAFSGGKTLASTNPCTLDSTRTILTVKLAAGSEFANGNTVNIHATTNTGTKALRAGSDATGVLYKAGDAITIKPAIESAYATSATSLTVKLPVGSTLSGPEASISGADCANVLEVKRGTTVLELAENDACAIATSGSDKNLIVTLADSEAFAPGDTVNIVAANSDADTDTPVLVATNGAGEKYVARRSAVVIAPGYLGTDPTTSVAYAVGPSTIIVQLPVASSIAADNTCSNVVTVRSIATPGTTRTVTGACSVSNAQGMGYYLTINAPYTPGDEILIKTGNTALVGGSDPTTGAAYVATEPLTIRANFDDAVLTGPTTVLVTMAAPTAVSLPDKEACDAVFVFTGAGNATKTTSPISSCSRASNGLSVTITLTSADAYVPGDALDIKMDQGAATVGSAGTLSTLVPLPVPTTISPRAFGASATLVGATSVALSLPAVSTLPATPAAADCNNAVRYTDVSGVDAVNPFTSCAITADTKGVALNTASPLYKAGDVMNVKSGNNALRWGSQATGAAYYPADYDVTVFATVATATLVDPSSVVVNLPAVSAIPENFTVPDCLRAIEFKTAAGAVKNGTVASCSLMADRLGLQVKLLSAGNFSAGDTVNIKPQQAELRVSALATGPSYVPKLAAQVVNPALFANANLTSATAITVRLPFASALASGSDCKTVLALLGAGGVAKNVSSCSLGADGVTLAVTIPASSFVGGDVLNIVPGQSALTLADGSTAYVPSKAGVLVTPNIVSAALTNATIISVTLPTASVLTGTAAADCNAAFALVSNGSIVASPLSACAVGTDGLTLTLTAAATYKPMAGDTVDVVAAQTVLRAGSATGPAYVPRPSPALITVPSPPPSPPPSPAPSPPPSPPVSTANYSARGLATGPLSCNVIIGADTVTTTSGNFTGLPSYAGKDAGFSGSCKDAVTGAVYTDNTTAATLPAGLTGIILSPVTALASVWDIKSVADLADTNRDYLRLLGVPVNASAYGSATNLLAYDYYVKGFVALETPAVAVMNVEGMIAANLLMYTKFFDGLNSSVAGRDITAGQALAALQYTMAMGLEMATAPLNTTSPSAILDLLNATYSLLTSKDAPSAGRRLLQTASAVPFSQLQAQAAALAAAAADSNALVAVQQAKLIAAINAGTSISAADLTNIINEASKVIVTQSTVIANAATGLASGSISPAQFTGSYTGSALTTLVAQQQLAATPGSDVTASPPPAPPSDDSKSNTGLIVGLVVGLVGGAIVITLIVVFIVMRRRKQNVAAAGQATA